jgi:Putative inner membrane protein (DUF1819)
MYNAEISAGSLMPQESRRVAALLLTHPTPEAWDAALKEDNFLQKKTVATARRQSRLIRNRLQTLDDQGLNLVASGSQEVMLQMLLVAALRHSQLLADYFRTVYLESLRAYDTVLTGKKWDAFLEECDKRDPAVATWSDSTKAKLFQVLVRILAEAKYLDSTRSRHITPQALHPEVARYLAAQSDSRILSLLQATS